MRLTKLEVREANMFTSWSM